MKTCFNLIDIPVRDLIADNHPVEDIVAVTQFQTAINCHSTIESLRFVDLNQEVEDDNKIVSILYLLAVVNGETFKIIVHATSDDQMLTLLLKYSNGASAEERNKVMEYVRKSLE